MKTVLFRSVLSCALLTMWLPATSQTLKVESQGQAAVDAENDRIIAVAMSKAVGLPVAGKGQIVFFRTSKSPGAAVEVDADGEALGELPAGMYFAVPASAGTHAYTSGDVGSLSMNVTAGSTYYVQVIRNRAGRPQLLRSTATKFQRATQH